MNLAEWAGVRGTHATYGDGAGDGWGRETRDTGGFTGVLRATGYFLGWPFVNPGEVVTGGRRSGNA